MEETARRTLQPPLGEGRAARENSDDPHILSSRSGRAGTPVD